MKMSLTLSVLFVASLFVSHAHAAGGEGGAHRDNTTLFPQPKADPSKASAPGLAKPSSPTFLEVVTADSVKLEWDAAENASVYHVQVATDANFKWLVTENHRVEGESFQVSGLEKGKRYFWRVAAWTDGNMASTNKGTFSVSSFETK